jgi:threonine synthase
MLAVRYDLAKVSASLSKGDLLRRPAGMYRFRELTPLAPGEEPITLGEGGTTLLPLPRLAQHLGLRHLWAKDAGQNPTGSFKARRLGRSLARTGVKGL